MIPMRTDSSPTNDSSLKQLVEVAQKPIRKKSAPELYRLLEYRTSFLPISAKIKERIYCVINDIFDRPLCGQCLGPVKFKGPHYGYQPFCSCKCSGLSDATLSKRIATNLVRFGEVAPMLNHTIKAKQQTTIRQKYGENVKSTQQVVETRQKTQKTVQTLYASDAYTTSVDFINKRAATYKKKYAGLTPIQSHISAETFNILSNSNLLRELNSTLNLVQIAERLNVSVSLISRYFQKFNIVPQLHNTGCSALESEVKQFVQSIYEGPVLLNDRRLIKPKEVDIYLPKLNLAIEFCGLYWHSDAHLRIDRNYHLNKLIECRKEGVRLLTLFEDEWINKKQIVQQMLTHILQIDTQRIGARQTSIDYNVPKADKKAFFNKNHLQGDGRGSITIGLKFNHRYVSMMTFLNHGKGLYELNRFASVGNVSGAFTKLLSAFKRSIDWAKIVSYADRRWSDGDVYIKSGFSLANISTPSYYYIKQTLRLHRKHFMKAIMHKKLAKVNPTLTERENCELNGIHRIWDCGQLRFETINLS